jgi:hypothetical protein
LDEKMNGGCCKTMTGPSEKFLARFGCKLELASILLCFRPTRLSVSYSDRFSFANVTQQVEVDSGNAARRSYRQGFSDFSQENLKGKDNILT